MAERVIAIWDIGKTNAKLCAVRAHDGAFVADAAQNFVALPGPPYPHLDSEGIWTWGLSQLRELAGQFEVGAIVVTAHGATCAVVDDENLVLPIHDYEDASPAECEADYAKLRPPFAQTYSPPLSGSLNYGRGLYWQSQRFPAEFARVRYVLNYAQYWSWRLSGVAAGEVSSIGSHSDLWDPTANNYSSLVTNLGWEKLFPAFRHASDVLGPLRTELVQATGLPADCAVLCGIHDSNASLLPWLTRPLPFTVASTGTWVINFAVGAQLEQLDPTRDCAANVTIEGIPIACSRWMGGREYATMVAGEQQAPTAPAIQACVQQEIMFIPPQGGQGGPFGHLAPPGELGGLNLDQAAADPVLRVAAASLYCALMLDLCLDLCASAGPIIVEGPFAHNDMLVGVLATLRPAQQVEVSTDPTGTTIGAARMALPELPALATRKINALADRAALATYRASWLAQVAAAGD